MIQGIKLLKEVKARAREGIGFHSETTCPIACAYSIEATELWTGLIPRHRRVLMAWGWTGKIYREFILWYDAGAEGGEVREIAKQVLRKKLK